LRHPALTLKILIAITACHKRADYCNYQRGAWVTKIGGPYKHRFFYGAGSHPFNYPDEVQLDVPDDYDNLALKIRAMLTWAYQEGFDAVFKCDDDTYLFPERLAALKRFDYAGEAREFDGLGSKICSGGGYWLSRRALKAVVTSDKKLHYKYFHSNPNPGWRLMQEDWWIATVMKNAGIKSNNVPGISSRAVQHEPRIASWEYPGLAMVREHRRHHPLELKLTYEEF